MDYEKLLNYLQRKTAAVSKAKRHPSEIEQLRQRVAELESLLKEAYADADEVLRPRVAELENKLEMSEVIVCADGALITGLTAERDALKQQRDDLLAALEMIAGKRYCLDPLMSNSDIAKAAIASVKEKQNGSD